ncbi:MAG: AI-2E family transporter [Candidatus Saganbacteria bacterium]|nr:AI-2E family transporter [Candidatus Saganbacteria bacterium]
MNQRQITRIIAVLLFSIFLFLIRNSLFPIIVSIILFYLLDPLVNLLSNKWPKGLGINRALSTLVSFIIFITIISLLLTFILPVFIAQFEQLINNLPQFLAGVQTFFNGLQQWYSATKVSDQVNNLFINALQNILNFMLTFAQETASNLLGLLSQFINLIIIPIVAFYLLVDREKVVLGILKYIPDDHRQKMMDTLSQINDVMHNFIRGQLILSLIVGLLTGLGLYFLGVKFFLLLALIAAITDIIPYLGPVLGAVPAVIISLFVSPWLALAVIILYITVQVIENCLLAPRIFRKRLGLNPVTVILAILILHQFIGAWGLFFAAPIVAILKIIYLETQKND